MARQYSDREVSLILQRALEPGTEVAATEAGEAGLTLEQIKEIAAEVGIDPRRVEVAAANLAALPGPPPNPYAGIPTTVQFETAIPGKTMADLSRHDVLALIRGILGRQGVLEPGDDSLEWRARDAFGGRYVSVTPSADGLRLRVMGNYRDGLFVTAAMVGAVTFTAASAVIAGAHLGPAVTLLGAAVAAMIPPRLAYRWRRKQEDEVMARLHRELGALLNTPAPPNRLAPGNEEPT